LEASVLAVRYAKADALFWALGFEGRVTSFQVYVCGSLMFGDPGNGESGPEEIARRNRRK
jgi:hypothetical protein